MNLLGFMKSRDMHCSNLFVNQCVLQKENFKTNSQALKTNVNEK